MLYREYNFILGRNCYFWDEWCLLMATVSLPSKWWIILAKVASYFVPCGVDQLAPAGARLKTATNASFPPLEYEWWRSCYERPLSASFWIRLCLMSPLPLCEKNLSMNFCTRTKRSFNYTISSRRRPALDWCWLRYLHLSTSAGIQKVRVWEHAHLPKHSVLENIRQKVS